MRRLLAIAILVATGYCATAQVKITPVRGLYIRDSVWFEGGWVKGITLNLNSDDSSADFLLPSAKAVADWVRSHPGGGGGGGGAVSSVFGRIGDVSAAEADYQSFYPRLSQAYSNPSWITALGWSKITGRPTTLEGYGITNAANRDSTYTNPSWITSLPWSKITGRPTTLSGYGITDGVATGGSYANPSWLTSLDYSKLTNGPTALSAFTNDVAYITLATADTRYPLVQIAYTNPFWIGSLAWSKITGTPTTLSGYGITDGVATGGSYANPSWLTSLAWNKLTGVPADVDITLDATSLLEYAPNSIRAKYESAIWNANKVNGYAFSNIAPSNGQVWAWNTSTSQYEPTTINIPGNVTSVFGRTGVVVATEADYQTFYPRLSQAYANPSWISSLAWSKVTSRPTTLSGYGITDAVAIGGSYANPSWLTSLDFSKLTNVPDFDVTIDPATLQEYAPNSIKVRVDTAQFNANKIQDKPVASTAPTDGQVLQYVSANGRYEPKTLSIGGAVSSVFGRTGAVAAAEADYQSFYPRLSQSYANPSWISSLAWSKITGTPTTLSGYGITDGLNSSGSYANPSWITSLAWSKITGTPTTLSGYGITDALSGSGSTGFIPKYTGAGTLGNSKASDNGTNFTYNSDGDFILKRITDDGISRGLSLTNAAGTERAFLKLIANTGEVKFGGSTSGFFPVFYANGTDAGRINTSQEWLLGTSTDAGAFRLQAAGNTYLNGKLSVGTTGTGATITASTANAEPVFAISNTVANNYTSFQVIGTGRTFSFSVGNASETFYGVANKFHLFDNTAGAVRFVVDQTGQMGIGNTSPGYMLDVSGTGHFTNQLTLAAAATGYASLQMPIGTAPTSPVNGNFYFDGTHLYMRIGGVWRQLDQQGAGTISTTNSLTGDGSGGSPVKLVNDVATPGANKDYNTDFSGTKGWHDKVIYGPDNSTLYTDNVSHVIGTYTPKSSSEGGILRITVAAWDNTNQRMAKFIRVVTYHVSGSTVTIDQTESEGTDFSPGGYTPTISISAGTGVININGTGMTGVGVYWQYNIEVLWVNIAS